MSDIVILTLVIATCFILTGLYGLLRKPPQSPKPSVTDEQ